MGQFRLRENKRCQHTRRRSCEHIKRVGKNPVDLSFGFPSRLPSKTHEPEVIASAIRLQESSMHVPDTRSTDTHS